jgi:hypothetical protein
MSTHTPGPWRWQDRYDFREHKEHQQQGLDADCENIRDGRIQLMAGDIVVLDEWGGYDDSGVSVRMEDARLIAAAPDLLDVIKALLEGFDCGVIQSATWNRARRAVEKAEGR